MPSPRRRTRAHRDGHVHRFLCETLLSGFQWFDLAFTEAELRTAWNELGEELLARWIAACPGRRPFAFWKFDTKEPRRLLDGVEDDGDTAPRLRFGIPPGQDEFYESEAAYLKRLGLMKAPERRALARLQPAAVTEDGRPDGAPFAEYFAPDIGLGELVPPPNRHVWARPREIY